MDTNNLKRKHERFICDELLKVINQEAEFLRMGNDRDEPDVIYRAQNKILGIELGTAYYDESDAKQEWTLARGERQFPKEGFEVRAEGVIRDPDKLICEKVQHELDDKCSKQYRDVDETWLCIEQRAALSDAKSVAKCMARLKVPETCTFSRIYVFYLAPAHDGGAYTAVQLK